MPYYVRKIEEHSHWEFEFKGRDLVPADTITRELKTRQHKLSFWKIEDLGELKDVAFAISTSFKPSNTSVIAIPISEFIDFEMEKSDGETAYTKFVSSHYDVVNLNHAKLGLLAEKIFLATKADIPAVDALTSEEIKEKFMSLKQDGLVGNRYLNSDLKNLIS